MSINNFKSLEELSKQDYLIYDDLAESIGRINNPLLHIPLKNNLDMICGAGSVTFTRSTTATYVDRYGTVKSSAINAARFEKEGLLIEGASTNKVLYSGDISNSYWQKQQGSVTTSTITSPDGTNTAYGFISDSTTNVSHQVFRSGVLSADKTYSLSGFVKAGGKNYIRMQGVSWTSGWALTGVAAVYFDLINGTVGSTYNSGGMTFLDAKIETLSNGWFRCSISFIVASGTDVYNTQTSFLPAISTSAYYYTGDGSTTEFHLWGAQLEELPFASSYIPTTTAAVTRSGDNCVVTSLGNMPEFSTDEGTLLIDCDAIGVSTDFSQFLFYNNDYNQSVFSEANYSDSWITLGNASWRYYSKFKSCIKYRVGCVCDKIYAINYLDGEKISIGNLSSHVISTNSTRLGSALGNRQLFGHLSNFRIYDIALTEKEMRIA